MMSTIELKNIKKIYGSGNAQTIALKGVDFEAEKGEVVLLEGPSGAGKSTLLTIMGSLQKASSGTILFNGENVTEFSDKQRDNLRLNKIGFVLQAYNLVPFLKVKEQFELVNRVKKTGNLSSDELADLVKLLGIEQLLNKYPNELSGGQMQRVAIARALYANPQVILADEPTASLDSERVKEVGALFKKLAKKQGKAVILVTHDQRLEAYCDHIYDMLDGNLTKRK
ncbi:ABC transporter ATP-binding protein [Lactobacillus jensenii]|jgi:bacitracin export ATP-binding protein bceA|uniref:Putative hemin import ATP-binding protein HrtA n=2 Tax=Lactobacillus jensenii TaxID=109790 RepID=A0A5N1IAE9_LACJE|nr:ABC transporter, ATP-binding protein [Lactobacillus jensenii 269-3]EEX27107.1 ABC transporter, ATP-binding protein [Lactobacillus jensenii SJ-7A-US]KAA9236121.1 ABC transporter ATP-binding protein [Lactobacillus jensenii]KRM51064.1 bacitracin export ATP-binding protein BceA [Lactobacillus jensenii DSM 20557]KAA9259384.1 ABC transporter ATP-binding protein [Lactobacillus jensenii]